MDDDVNKHAAHVNYIIKNGKCIDGQWLLFGTDIAEDDPHGRREPSLTGLRALRQRRSLGDLRAMFEC